MCSPQVLIVILATVTLSVTGCSGGGLRNLTAKSDYRTLEELENPTLAAAERREADQRQDELAKAADQKTTATVSSEKDLVADKTTADPGTADPAATDPAAEKSAKPLSSFRLANLFRRKAATEDIGPDPFVKETESEDVKTASADRSEFESEKSVAQASTTKSATIAKTTADSPTITKDFGTTTISEVEKQAETQFDKALARQQAKEDAADTKTVAAKTTSEGPGELSFADFLKKHQSQADAPKPGAPETPVVAAEATAKKPAPKASPEASVFDTFLDDAVDGKAEQLVADSDVPQTAVETADVSVAGFDIFEPASQANPDAAENPDTDVPTQNPFAQDALVAAEFAAPFPDNPFEETSEKHGFTRHNSDPWAALASKNPTAVKSPRHSAPSQDFAWNESADSAAAEPTAKSSKVATSESADESRFRQVSLTRPTDVSLPGPIDVSQSAPLLIPDNPETDHGRALFEEVATSDAVAAEFTSDPFLTSAPFAATADGSQKAATSPTAAAPIAATESGGLWPWNGRTWFLLIGCLIVAVLLFMPDRQNRSNTKN